MSFFQLRSPRFNNSLDVPGVAISTQAATNVANTTATGNGTLANLGSGTVIAMGFVWATHTSPTLADNVVTVSNTTGAYTGSLTGLSAGTQIYYDAYFTNTGGTTYGGDQTFTTTGAGAVVSAPAMALMGMG